MANPTTFDGDVYFGGNSNVVFAGELTLADDCVGDNQVTSTTPLTAIKVKHQHQPVFAQKYADSAAAERRVVFVAKAAGVLKSFVAGCAVANIGDSTETVDLYKNGTTVLASPIGLSSSQAARETVAGTLSVTTYSAGDVFEVVTTATVGTGTLGKGLFAEPVFQEVGVA